MSGILPFHKRQIAMSTETETAARARIAQAERNFKKAKEQNRKLINALDRLTYAVRKKHNARGSDWPDAFDEMMSALKHAEHLVAQARPERVEESHG